MNWIVAGLIAGVGAFFSDYVMWGKVFTGPEVHGFATMPPTPEEQKKMMLPAMLKSAALALVFGLLLACGYQRLKGGLWVQGGGPLAGMEFATLDRKSTRLNSSHGYISYAVFCLKKKK